MKIKSVTVGGFKNLERTQIELEKITALVSPNNYGKSNFLQGVNFALDFLAAGEKGRHGMSSWKKGIPLHPQLENKPFLFEIEFNDPKLEQYQFVRYGFSFSWFREGSSNQGIVDEWLEMRHTESVKFTSYLKRIEGRYRKAKSTTAFRTIILSDFQLALDILPSIKDVEYLSALKLIRNLQCKMCSSLDMDWQYDTIPFELENGTASSSLNQIPQLLYSLKENDSERFLLFEEAITNLFPEITRIEVFKAKFDPPLSGELSFLAFKNGREVAEEEPKKPVLKLKDEYYKIFVKTTHLNQVIDIAQLSLGTKRLIWIIANLFCNEADSFLMGIEELEASIHPRLLGHTLEILNEYLDNVILLITSHSPYLIQYLKMEKIYIGIPSKTGIATFQRIAKTKVRALVSAAQNLGLSHGEYLFDLMSTDAKTTETLKNFLGGSIL